jgi:hypothetical protein
MFFATSGLKLSPLLTPKPHIIDLATVEATTGLRAAIIATELEYQHVELKGDALQMEWFYAAAKSVGQFYFIIIFFFMTKAKR